MPKMHPRRKKSMVQRVRAKPELLQERETQALSSSQMAGTPTYLAGSVFSPQRQEAKEIVPIAA